MYLYLMQRCDEVKRDDLARPKLGPVYVYLMQRCDGEHKIGSSADPAERVWRRPRR